MRLFSVASFVVALILLNISVASAQDHRLSVRVEDPSGATIPNASIIVLSGSDLLTEQNADGKGIATINVGSATAVKQVERARAPGSRVSRADVAHPASLTRLRRIHRRRPSFRAGDVPD